MLIRDVPDVDLDASISELFGVSEGGQVCFTVEPRDAEGVQPRGQPAAVLLAVTWGGRRA
jgi:hypothetical protein